MITVSKEIRFEAGHRLVNDYPGKCKHAHGHSYVAIITMELNEGVSLNKYGFVKDYGDFKEVKDWVDDNWDHSFLVARTDFTMRKFLEENEQRHWIFNDSNPTAEAMAKELYHRSSGILNDTCATVTEVRLKETATSEAVYNEVKRFAETSCGH